MTDAQASLAACDTVPKLLLRNATKFTDKTAYRVKDLGIWQAWTWAETADEVRNLALGFAALGMVRGDKVAIVGSNRPELYWAIDAIEAIGGIPIPLYADSVADEMRYVLEHAEVRFAICEDQEQIDKIMSIMTHLPKLETLIFEDQRGMRHYQETFLHSFEKVQETGRKENAAKPEFFENEIAKANGEDMAMVVYTSGTTGNPKGVMLTHNALIDAARGLCDIEGYSEDEDFLAYLPMAWIGDHLFSTVAGHYAGFAVNCPESTDTVMTDLKDIGPTILFSPPAIFENFLTQIQIRMEDSGKFKRWIYDRYMKVAEEIGVKELEGGSLSFAERISYTLGHYLVYGPLKDNLGFTRCKKVYTGGAPLGEEVFNFYRSIGLNLKQIYGQTESTAYCCIQLDGKVRRDTVGPPCPGVELAISDSGEILYKSPGTFIGYYKNDEATRETIDEDGWVHTGDAGIIDDSGELRVIDRAKDVGVMNDGTLFAPQYIENKLKFFPYIREAVAHGDKRDEVNAFINIDLEAVGNWAERQGLSYTNYTDLASNEAVYDLIKGCVEEVNKTLAEDSQLANAQINRFLLLHKELDADDGELTRTRKVRRRVIADRYGAMIDALYSDVDAVDVETEVTFEDGRKGSMKAHLNILAAERFATTAKAA
jgi:long-chain acyl-CoA synthetase